MATPTRRTMAPSAPALRLPRMMSNPLELRWDRLPTRIGSGCCIPRCFSVPSLFLFLDEERGISDWRSRREEAANLGTNGGPWSGSARSRGYLSSRLAFHCDEGVPEAFRGLHGLFFPARTRPVSIIS